MRKKALIFLTASAIAVAGGSCADLSVSPGAAAEAEFERQEEMILERMNALRQKAQSFDQQRVMKNLRANPLNGFYYRLDEHLKEAVFSGERKGVPDSPYLFHLEFDGRDATPVKAREGWSEGPVNIKNGILRLDAESRYASWVETAMSLQIPVEEIGEVEIRARSDSGGYMKFAISSEYIRKREEGQSEWRRTPRLRIDMPGDGIFRTFRLNGDAVFKGKLNPGKFIDKLLFAPATREKGRVEIDYIRIYTREGRYGRSAFGLERREIANETRPVIYVRSPGSLRFSVRLPETEVYLSFGSSVLLPERPVKITVSVEDETGKKNIFTEDLMDQRSWKDFSIDLTEFSGHEVSIALSGDSGGENIVFFSNPLLYSPPKEKFNVILIIEDALRADHTSFGGHYRDTTPAKAEWAKRGGLFLNVFAQGPSTRIAMASMMTSLYPSATGVWSIADRLEEAHLTLAEVMRAQGFVTAAFIQNPNAGAGANLHQGYSYCHDGSDTAGGRAQGIYLRHAPQWIERHGGRNFFLYIHILDPHGIYNPEEKFRSWYHQVNPQGKPETKVEGIDPGWVDAPTEEGRKALYDGEIRMNDKYFKEFIEKLKGLGKLDDTLMIFISDHGEHLGAHGLQEHGSPGYIQTLKVPLVMVYPGGVRPGSVIEKAVQHIDIMPTILEYARISTGGMLLSGDSLVPLMKGDAGDYWDRRPIISEEPGLKKTRNDESDWASIFSGGTHFLNSLKTGFMVFDYKRDVEEIHNLARGEKQRKDFRELITKFQKANVAIWKILALGKSGPIEYDPDEVRQIRALGYLN